MPSIPDFRLSQFELRAIDRCGKYIGNRTYWKLYTIENLFRVVVHSVLSVQIPTGWWEVAVDKTIRNKAESFQRSYLRKSWHGKPGSHGIYYIDLKDLNEILRANANLFDPVIPDLDKWVLGIEELRLPRNVIAHMNFPSGTDIKRIDVLYDDCQSLIAELQARMALSIP